MVQHSTVPSVMAALMAQIPALPAISTGGTNGGPVQVAWDWPGSTVQAECIYLGRVHNVLAPKVMHGAQRRSVDEDYTVEVFIDATTGGSDANPGITRVYALWNALDDMLAADPTLGATPGVRWVLPAQMELTTYYDEDRRGVGARLKVELAVKARML